MTRRNSLVFEALAVAAFLLPSSAGAKVSLDEAMRTSVQALERSTTLAALKAALEGLAPGIQQQSGHALSARDLGVAELLKLLGSDKAAQKFSSRASASCGSMARGRRTAIPDFVANVAACLLEAAKEAGAGGFGIVRRVVRNILSAARSGAQVLGAALLAQRGRLAGRLDDEEIKALLPDALVSAMRKVSDSAAQAFLGAAEACGALAPAPGEIPAAFAGRAGKCLVDAASRGRTGSALAKVRDAVRALASGAARGGKRIRHVLEQAAAHVLGVVEKSILFPDALREKLAVAKAPALFAFAANASSCAQLAATPDEAIADFARRAAACLAAGIGRRAIPYEALVRKAIDEIIAAAQRGPSALRAGIRQAVESLPKTIATDELFPKNVRTALAKANMRMTSSFIRGARECRRIVRGDRERGPRYVRKVGSCLANAIGDPAAVVKAIAGSVRSLLSGMARGAARKGFAEAERVLQGIVGPTEIYDIEVRSRVARFTPAWGKQFAKLAVPCRDRKFKPHHNLEEHIFRVKLCLSAAARGITGDAMEADMRTSIRAIVAGARKGQRALHVALDREVGRLSRVMRVNDLFPERLQKVLVGRTDESAREFAKLAAACADTKRPEGQRLGDFAKTLQKCLRAAHRDSSSEALAKRVREAVQVLVAGARDGASALRSALGPATAALLGMPAERLFTSALQSAIAKTTDDKAGAFAAAAAKCADLELGDLPIDRFLGRVSRCLVGSSQAVIDKEVEGRARAAVEELAELAAAGADKLRAGFAALQSKVKDVLRLPGDVVAGLDFEARSDDFSRRIRSSCSSLPGRTAHEQDAIIACLKSARSEALKILPPDECRGKSANDLFECCMAGGNRELASCAQHRTACRPGYAFQTATRTCAEQTCPSAQVRFGSATCVRIACPPGETYDLEGTCVSSMAVTAAGQTIACPAGSFLDVTTNRCLAAACAPGTTRDARGHCVRATCPTGTVLDAGQRCSALGCSLGFVRNAFQQCEAATCVLPARLDRMGRCIEVMCPVGFAPQGGFCAPAH